MINLPIINKNLNYEEKLLIKTFGSAYGEYMRKVPMFLHIKNIKR